MSSIEYCMYLITLFKPFKRRSTGHRRRCCLRLQTVVITHFLKCPHVLATANGAREVVLSSPPGHARLTAVNSDWRFLATSSLYLGIGLMYFRIISKSPVLKSQKSALT